MDDSRTNGTTMGSFGHFRELDGLRGLSIILVLIGHTALGDQIFPAELNVQLGKLAGLGVLLFFTLSGFLITGLLVSEELQKGSISLQRFYTRRAIRIMPAFYLMLLICWLLTASQLLTDESATTLLMTAFYLRDFAGSGGTLSHTWSLSIEEQFYLLWPWILVHLQRDKRIAVASCLCLIAPAARAIAYYSGNYLGGHYTRPWYWLDCILAGCVIALVWTEHRSTLQLAAKSINGAVVLSSLFLWTLLIGGVTSIDPFYRTVQVCLAAAILTSLLANHSSLLAKVMCSRVLGWFGKMSYSIYLWQQIFLITKLPSWGVLRLFPVDLACTLAAAALSYYVIERPCLKWKSRWS